MREVGSANIVLSPAISSGVGVLNPDSIMEMAEQTGGTAISDSNDVGALVSVAMSKEIEGE